MRRLKIVTIDRLTLFQIFFSIFIATVLLMDFSMKNSQIVLCLVFTECVLISFSDRFFNVYQVFLLMMFLFNLSIPVFNLLGLYEYPSGFMFMYSQGIKTVILEKTLCETYKVLTIFLMGTSIGWLLGKKKTVIKKEQEERENIKYRIRNDKIYKWIFYIILPLEFMYEVILTKYSLEVGYIATMHLHSYAGTFSNVFSIVDYLYPFIGLSALYMCRDKQSYFKMAGLFILPFIVQMFTGLRGNFVSIFLAVLFVYSWRYRQIKVKEIVLIFSGLFFVIVGLGVYRFSHSTSGLYGGLSEGVLSFIIDEICANGESIVVISYTIQLIGSFFNKIPFLLGYIGAIFSFSSNYSYAGLLDKSYLAQHITYLLNPNRFYGGSTIGTAIAAEFYEFANGNYFVILILSIMLLYFACFFIKKMYKSQLWFFFAVSYLQNLFLSPRGSVMKIFSKLSLIYVVIYIIFKFLLKESED